MAKLRQVLSKEYEGRVFITTTGQVTVVTEKGNVSVSEYLSALIGQHFDPELSAATKIRNA